MWEVGGRKDYRKYWGRYSAGSDGVLYVIDAADSKSFMESAECLVSFLSLKCVKKSWPVAILLNKMDRVEFDGELMQLKLEQILATCPDRPHRYTIVFVTAMPMGTTEEFASSCDLALTDVLCWFEENGL